MRQFCARWWVTDPLAKLNAEIESSDDGSFTIRYVREATAEDVKREIELWEFVHKHAAEAAPGKPN